MNKERRKQITDVIDGLETLMLEIERIQYDEQEAFDNLPEDIQMSERGEAMETAVVNLEDAYRSLEEVIEQLNEAAAN